MASHLYRRKPRTGCAINLTWHAWYSDAAGNRVRFSTGCTDKQAAAKILAERERSAAAEAASGLAANSTSKTVEDALDRLVNVEHSGRRGNEIAAGTKLMWWQKAAHLVRLMKTCGGCAFNDRDGSLTAACDAAHGSYRLADLRRAHVKTYVDHRLGEGATRSTVAKELSTLAAALRFAADREWMSEAAASAAIPKFSAQSTPKTRWLTHDEFPRLLAALDTTAQLAADLARTKPPLSDIECAQRLAERRAEVTRRELFVWLGCLTGAELSVLEALQWADVDLEAGRIRLRGTKTAARDRTVAIDPGLATQLAAVPLEHRIGAVLGVWANVRRDLAAACVRAGIPAISPHGFRHTFASWLVQRGVDLFVVAKLMGHGSTAMVQRHYGHLSPKNFEDAIAMLPTFDIAPSVGHAPTKTRILCVTGVSKPVETDGFHGVYGANGSASKTLPSFRKDGVSEEKPRILRVPKDGVEPPTRGFSVRCSTN